MKIWVKKLTATIVSILLIFSMVSCGAPSDVKQEAKDRLEKYKPSFEQKVEEEYGSDAKLKNVQCQVERRVGSPVPETSYAANSYLDGTLVIDGKSYETIYVPDSDTLMDTYHTKELCDSIVSSLPITESDVITVNYTDSNGTLPMFSSEVDSIEKLAESESSNVLNLSIVTSEDLSKYKEADFVNISELVTLKDSKSIRCIIKIASIKDKGKASALANKLRELDFSYSHPNVYSNNGDRDAYEVYGINSVITIHCEEGQIRYNYLD